MSDLKPLLEVFLNSAFTSSSFSSKALHKLSLFIYPVPSLHHDTSWSPRNTFLQKCNRNGGSTVLWWVNLVLPLINDLSPANKSWQGFGKVHLMNETLTLKILYLFNMWGALMPLGTYRNQRAICRSCTSGFNFLPPFGTQKSNIRINGKSFYPINCLAFCGLATFRTQGEVIFQKLLWRQERIGRQCLVFQKRFSFGLIFFKIYWGIFTRLLSQKTVR